MLRIVQVNTVDIGGGAAKVACSLHRLYRRLGHRSILVVGRKRSDDPDVLALDNSGRKSPRELPGVLAEKLLGRQYLAYPGSRRIGELVGDADVFHLHNLHGGYFDLAALPALSRRAPTVAMMHDAWLLTGHCACHLECERWLTGCGRCPHLRLDPALRVDGTRFNWRRKQRLLAASRLWVTAPSDWLVGEARRSPLLSRFQGKMVRNGVDLEVFSPGSREKARRNLNLPEKRRIVLFLAHLGLASNTYKDPATLASAIRLLRSRMGSQAPLFLAVGASGELPPEWKDLSGVIECRPFVEDGARIADFYRASDLYAHVSIADNCPLTVLEAMACARPVVATAVGGVPELVAEGATGRLVPPGDAEALASAIEDYLSDEDAALLHGEAGRKAAEAQFDVRVQARSYLQWYAELISEAHGGGGAV